MLNKFMNLLIRFMRWERVFIMIVDLILVGKSDFGKVESFRISLNK